jgi:hypothetical protein
MQVMRFSKMIGVAALMAGVAVAGAASASVIPGPVLDTTGGGFSDTGLGFQALDNSTLTAFTFQNQGQADTIVLTDALGNILDSISTPASTPTDTVAVNWSLTSGSEYWLLQTAASNELFAFYGGSLPSNSDIAIVQSGTFDYSIPGAVTNSYGWGANEYWAGFNDITTQSSGGVPEPGAWALMLLGFGAVGAALRQRRASFSAA